MLRSSLPFLLLLFLFACQTAQPSGDETTLAENTAYIRYMPSDIQKMGWLAGAWKGETPDKVIRQSFQFHGNSVLEVLDMDDDGDMAVCPLTWHDGRYYYGRYRQWVITWIGDKDVRFDPLRPGLQAMTWTRLTSDRWHLVRHTPGHDEIVVMERANEMQP
jgi:hypothetical protein